MVEPVVLAQTTGVGPGGVLCRKCCPGDVASWPPCRPHLLCRDCLAQLPPPHSTFVLPHISISLRHGASALLVLKHFSHTRRRLAVSRRFEAVCHGAFHACVSVSKNVTGWGRSGFAPSLGKWKRSGNSTRKLEPPPLTGYCQTLRIHSYCLNLLTDLKPETSLSEQGCTQLGGFTGRSLCR